jgi:hypothetical protein
MVLSKNQHTFFSLTTNKDSLNRALRVVAVIVGSILNLINNPYLFKLSVVGVNIYRVLLTFMVPF